MAEKDLWAKLRDKLCDLLGKANCHLVRVESTVGAGFPDVDYCLRYSDNGFCCGKDGVAAGSDWFSVVKEGKIELKWHEKLPKREGTRLFGDSGLREAQVYWIKKRMKAGGKVWIFFQVEKWYFLVDGMWCEQFNFWNLDDFIKYAEWQCYKNLSEEALWDLVRKM